MRSTFPAAAMILLVLSAAAPKNAAAAPEDTHAPAGDNEARDRSRAAFRAGVAQLQAKDWKAARASFEQAYALYPHPSILLNLGIAHLKTDDPVLAEEELVKFLGEDFGSSPEELAGAREALAEARTKIGTIRVVASPSTAHIVVDGKPIAERVPSNDSVVAEVRAKAGKHTVSVDAEGHATEERNVQLAARAEVEVKIALAPAAGPKETPSGGTERSAGRTITGYALGGLAGVALVASGVCALRALSLSNEYGDRANPNGGFQNPDVKSEGIAFRTAADVALGVAIVSGAAAVILLFTDIGAGKGAGVAWRGNGRSAALLRW